MGAWWHLYTRRTSCSADLDIVTLAKKNSYLACYAGLGRRPSRRGGIIKGELIWFLGAGLTRGGSLACVDAWSNDATPYDKTAHTMSEFLGNMSPYRDCIDECRGRAAEVAAS